MNTQEETEKWEEGIRDELYKLFGMDGKDGTYWHILTRVKEARQVGTLTIDDYKEVEMDDMEDIVELIRTQIHLAEKRGIEKVIEAIPDNMINGYEAPGACMITVKQSLKDKFLNQH